MALMNKDLFDSYTQAEQELEGAFQKTEQKYSDTKQKMQSAPIPERPDTAKVIRDILSNAPESIGEHTYKGKDISQDDKMTAVTQFNRDFKAKDIILLTKYEDTCIVFTEEALYAFDDCFLSEKIVYSDISDCYTDNEYIHFDIFGADQTPEDIEIDFHNPGTFMLKVLHDNCKHFDSDAQIKWGSYGKNKYRSYLYNLIMDLKEAAEDI